ncbi:hypothetical protein U5640_35630 [Streptomyces sp. SS7]|uniref:hypothetical protein n=1 Tax=Streptomyces sp. SS7 TaxID=3108485 RepID=UPI0030EF9B76
MSDGNGVVHQMVFRWAGSRGAARGAGITAVAYSCDERVARDLAEQRGSVLRVKGGGERVSLVRLIHGGRAVLLRRMPEKDGNNRESNICHALMAPAGALTARRCLALGAGPWKEDKWFDSARGAIPGFALKDLQKLADRRQGPLRDGVILVREPLVRMVAELLREPGGRVSARIGELEAVAEAVRRELPFGGAGGAGDADGWPPDPALSALWALCDIFGGWLGHDGWTYATYDTSDRHPHRVVFVPDWRRSHVQDADLRRIRLTDVQQDHAAFLARMLVTHYCDWLATGSLDNYPRPLDRAADAAALPEEERYDRVEAALTGRPRRPHRARDDERPAPNRAAPSDAWGPDAEAEGEIWTHREAWQAPPRARDSPYAGPGNLSPSPSPSLPLPTGWHGRGEPAPDANASPPGRGPGVAGPSGRPDLGVSAAESGSAERAPGPPPQIVGSVSEGLGHGAAPAPGAPAGLPGGAARAPGPPRADPRRGGPAAVGFGVGRLWSGRAGIWRDRRGTGAWGEGPWRVWLGVVRVRPGWSGVWRD